MEARMHPLTVERTARVSVIGGPQDDTSPCQETWIVCHGYRQLAPRFIRRFTTIATPGRRIVAPEGLSRFYLERPVERSHPTDPGPRHTRESPVGATWMTREERLSEIRDYVAYLDRVAERFAPDGVDGPARRILLGFSQGVHTAARWLAMGTASVDAAIFWGAYLPADLDLPRYRDRLAAPRLIQVHGSEDPTRNGGLQADQDARLGQVGLTQETRIHAGGHEIDRGLLEELASELGHAGADD